MLVPSHQPRKKQQKDKSRIIKDRNKGIMYFRYLLVAVLLACTYGYITHDNASPNSYSCICESGERGVTYDTNCDIGYQYCGATEKQPNICCLII